MEYFKSGQCVTFQNPGFYSEQLLFPENSRSERITITRVAVEPGCTNQKHRHQSSEQAWIALHGQGMVLLKGGEELAFSEGDVVRFSDGEEHGFRNNSDKAFVYLSVTSPPANFRSSYQHSK